MGRCWNSFEVHVWQSLDYLQRLLEEKDGIKSASDEASDGKKDYAVGHWMKGDLC